MIKIELLGISLTIENIGWWLFAYAIYDIFLSEWVKNQRDKNKGRATHTINVPTDKDINITVKAKEPEK